MVVGAKAVTPRLSVTRDQLLPKSGVEPTQEPLMAKQPEVREIPLAKVEEAVAVEVMAPVPVRVMPLDEERPWTLKPLAMVDEAPPLPMVMRSAPMVPATDS